MTLHSFPRSALLNNTRVLVCRSSKRRDLLLVRSRIAAPCFTKQRRIWDGRPHSFRSAMKKAFHQNRFVLANNFAIQAVIWQKNSHLDEGIWTIKGFVFQYASAKKILSTILLKSSISIHFGRVSSKVFFPSREYVLLELYLWAFRIVAFSTAGIRSLR